MEFIILPTVIIVHGTISPKKYSNKPILIVNLKPVTTEEFPRPAPRPKYSVLENYNWRMEGHPKIRSYKEALIDYLNLL